MNVALSRPPTPKGPKPRLAIVSTFDELCGIAAYTRALSKYLADFYDVRVFDLDQFFMRAPTANVRMLADRMINDICRELVEFDFVNIQLEFGTLGRRQPDIIRRFQALAAAAPALSVTFHTVLLRDDDASWPHVGDLVLKGRLRRAFTMANQLRYDHSMGRGIVAYLRRLQKKKQVSVIVHTRRDGRAMKYVNQIHNVFDHPLAFFTPAEAMLIRSRTSRADFPALAALPSTAKIVGVFGFLSEYKGIDTAIRALRHVPGDYHLAIFGGVHPNEIKRGAVDQYVAKLLAATYADASILDDLPEGNANVSFTAEQIPALFAHPRNLADRVHFMGAQTDEQFARGMSVCDIVVLGYQEVGQSSSGPMSIGVEVGARIIASRNHAFLQYAKYHPSRVEFFDIGNHLELAERIRSSAHQDQSEPLLYNATTNAQIYVAANSSSPAQTPAGAKTPRVQLVREEDKVE